MRDQSSQGDWLMTPNVALLKQTLAYIEAHPEEWDQEVYHCRSAACFAGHAATLDGGEWMHADSEYLAARSDDPADDTRAYSGGRATWVFYRAQRVLGLTRAQAHGLFDEENNLNALREIVSELTGDAS